MKFKIVFVCTALAIVAILFTSNTARSFSTGAPAGYCDAPANPGATCFACHNSGPSPVTIPGMITSNIPVNGYAPGSTYTITATVTRAGHNRFGFEISPQDLSGNLVGTMNDLGNETIFQQSGAYITHSSTSLLSNDFKTWQFEWTAPAAGSGAVTFYGAFNITNNDGSYTGDTIVLSTSTFPEDQAASVQPINRAEETAAWIYDGNLLLRRLPAGESSLSLMDLNGRIVLKETLNAQAGQSQIALPESLSQGLYVVLIEQHNYSWTGQVLKTR